MRRTLLVVLVVGLGLGVACADPEPRLGEVTASTLRFRRGPGTSHGVISALPRGTRVEILEGSGAWLKVRVRGAIGYVHGSYVKIESSAPASSSFTPGVVGVLGGEPSDGRAEIDTGSAGSSEASRASAGTSDAAAPASSNRWISLATGRLLIPARFTASGSKIDLLVHFHGADSSVEREFSAAGVKSALVVVNMGGLSSAYRRPFSLASRFPSIVTEALMRLGQERHISSPKLGRLILSSFSAGYAAVREILKQRRYESELAAVLLSDSLHASYRGGRPDPVQLAPFVSFAKVAASGTGKQLLVSHSAIHPGSYSSTTETADALIAAVGADRQIMSRSVFGMDQTSLATRGGFAVLGFSGRSGSDHMAHLRNLRMLFERLNLSR